MTREQIEKAAIKSADEELDDFECRGHRNGTIAGAQWRINSVWATRLSNSIPSAGSMSMRRITRNWKKDMQANQENYDNN